MAFEPIFEIIETSQNWICPATGKYLIIAVASGAQQSGSGLATNPTSFGGYVTSSGIGSKYGDYYNSFGGMGGYTLDGVYGGYGGTGVYQSGTGYISTTAPTKNGGVVGSAGSGWGAGATGSSNGKLVVKKVNLTSGEVVSCTIGAAIINGALASNSGVIIIRRVA